MNGKKKNLNDNTKLRKVSNNKTEKKKKKSKQCLQLIQSSRIHQYTHVTTEHDRLSNGAI